MESVDVRRLKPETADYYARRIAKGVSLVLRWVSAHWLLLANVMMGVYIGLPLLAPVLSRAGYTRTADLIHLVFSPLCHQLPERSFFLFGEQTAYTLPDLESLLGAGRVPLRYVGGPTIGYKIAVCQRDVAIYLTMLVAGMLFAVVRRHVRPLSWKLFIVLAFPMVVDGAGQLFRLWESTSWSRVVTGALFGLACVWFAYPYLEQGMREAHREMVRTLAEGSWEHVG